MLLRISNNQIECVGTNYLNLITLVHSSDTKLTTMGIDLAVTTTRVMEK